MSKEKFYVTTPIYYVNDVPHIGHSYTTIAADTLARYKRFKGFDVFFLTGTDEHGQKIQKAAEKQGKTPQELADEVVLNFQKLWERLDITNDFFIRTTSGFHKWYVANAFEKLFRKGDIYKGEYEGWYCVPCESYYSDLEVGEERVCPTCGRSVDRVREESYFFRLSAYQDKLLEFYEGHPDFVIPETRYNEIKSFVRSGLKDLSVTRISFDWGVRVPFDENHVVYVWFDALLNYLSVFSHPRNRELSYFWPADVHFVGKDILRFHAVYWPAFLMALGERLPKHVVAHGWWTVEGRKMSKSLGNVVDPNDIISRYPRDAYRYFLLRNVPFGLDGDFSERELAERINSELVNDLGNLVNRSLTMVKNYIGGEIKKPERINDVLLEEMATTSFAKISEAMERFRFDDALFAVFEFVRGVNKYITDREPWVLNRKGKMEELSLVLYNLLCSLKTIAGMILPFMPDTAAKILEQIGMDAVSEGLKYSDFSDFYSEESFRIAEEWDYLFRRVEIKDAKTVDGDPPEVDSMESRISVEEFFKVDLRVARILEAESVEGSRKLIRLKIDIGEKEPRTLVAGLKEFFRPEDLVDKLIVVVANLKPAKLMGIESNGMLLAAKDEHGVKLLTVDGNVKPGSRVS